MPAFAFPNLAEVPPLSAARYLETHVAFEGASDQQRQILERLSAMRLGPRAAILSVGCGSGILDAPLAARLARGRALRYVGLDPNPLECRAFRRALAELPLEGEVLEGGFEDYEPRERFHRILMIHSHYYLKDAPSAMARAGRMLEPEGRLVIAAAPREALNRLAEHFWPDRAAHDLWFSERLGELFERRGVRASIHRIDGRLDVSTCFIDDPRGRAIRDFAVQADVARLPPEARMHIDRALREMGRQEPDERFTVPHPVDMFELDASDAARLA